MSDNYEVIVIGGGAVGLAAARECGARGRRVLLLEAGAFFHDDGSSAGATRQFRIQHDQATPARLVLEALPLWRDLEAQAGVPLIHPVGCLWFGDDDAAGSTGDIKSAVAVMDALSLPYESLDASQLEHRFGFHRLPPSWGGFLQPDGGLIDVGTTLRTLHGIGEAMPHVTLRDRSPVTRIERGGDRWSVTAGEHTYGADKLVVAPGPFVDPVLAHFGLRLDRTLWSMVNVWFPIRHEPAQGPVWVNLRSPGPSEDPGLYYGFPEVPFDRAGYARVGGNFPSPVLDDIRAYDKNADPAVVRRIAGWVKEHMPGLDPEPAFASTCVAAQLIRPGDPYALRREFLLDHAPPSVEGHDDVVICATGWVFKLIPLVGRICADLVCDGTTSYDISPFRISDDTLR